MSDTMSPGLDNIVFAPTSISSIEPEQGDLAYRGFDIRTLVARSTFEEVAFLLLYGRLPAAAEFEAFLNDLARSRDLPPELLPLFRNMPAHAHPMDVLSAAVAFLGAVDPEGDVQTADAVARKALRTLAKLPTAVAAGWRMARGQEPIRPLRQLTHAQNFLYMLSGYGPDEDASVALDKVLILYAEHESDVSSFTARVAASSLTNYHSAVTAAIGSLKGRLHGGANEQAMRMLLEIGDPCQAEEWILDSLSRKDRIMGFGHRIYKHGDARMRLMKGLNKDLAERTGTMQWYHLCVRIEEIVLREKGLYPNIDFHAGPILHILGIPPELCTPIFAMGRIAGWSAHIIEQLCNNRLIRPRLAYLGPRDCEYVEIEKRSNGSRAAA